ncbi:MAG: zinc dependent phospholipase C family protein [Sedimentibacter sp.]
MSIVERSYSFIYRNITRSVNPLKKKIIKTECIVHKFINNQAIIILKNDGHTEVYNLMSNYIDDINEGAVWADQDFKSSSHFYNPKTKKGMYGSSNAKKECIAYYKRALNEYFKGDIKTAMFYLGAACHLIQDVTIPQHANVELLHNHRSYENWVIKMYNRYNNFKVNKSGIYLDLIVDYIDLNSRNALITYDMYSDIKNKNARFYKITSNVLTMAQKTTAGVMYNFFYHITKIKAINIIKKKSTY